MTKISRKTDSETWFIQRIARGISTSFFAFHLLIATGDWLREIDRGYQSLSTATLGVLLLVALVGIIIVLLGWWREGIGGLMLTIAGSAIIIWFMLIQEPEHYWVTLIIGAPFLASGILYLICWRRIRKQKIAQETT